MRLCWILRRMLDRILSLLYMMGMAVCYQLSSSSSACLNCAITPGGTVARFAGLNVHKRLLNEESYKAKNYEESLKRAFLGTDEDMLGSAYAMCLPPSSYSSQFAKTPRILETRQGVPPSPRWSPTIKFTSYVIHFAVLSRFSDLFIQANAGDSRSVLSIKGEVKPLSFDHKPTNEGNNTNIFSCS